ncbi:MAG: hypothetical protein E5V99_31890, partial [Mesorhizobium sp.]
MISIGFRWPSSASSPAASAAMPASTSTIRSSGLGFASIERLLEWRGTDSAVLLHMISEIDRTLPVIFLDTGKHFEETLGYRDALVADFGLTDVRVIKPDEAALERVDPTGQLNET